jgi:hypothetical protein
VNTNSAKTFYGQNASNTPENGNFWYGFGTESIMGNPVSFPVWSRGSTREKDNFSQVFSPIKKAGAHRATTLTLHTSKYVS